VNKIVWINTDAIDDKSTRKLIVTTSLENNFTDIIVRDEDKEVFCKLGKFNLICSENNELIFKDKTCKYVDIKSKEDENYAKELAGKVDFVIVSALDWKVIPIENLIAAFQNIPSKLLVEVENIEDAKLFFETLEVGVDGVVLNSKDPNMVFALRELIEEAEVKSLSLVSATITQIKSLGSGDRVCIDSCSLLSLGEGMLIGSQSNGLFLVHSESVKSEYVGTRPFRVNAGPVHSYIKVSPLKTRYLSELKTGDEVISVNQNGECRTVVLGRVKIEKRPLILIVAEYEEQKYNIILQNAETIRLISSGLAKSVVDLKEGDKILMSIDTGGRHFGMKVKESIIEQ
jgi:3-dehydroquinate synthase II